MPEKVENVTELPQIAASGFNKTILVGVAVSIIAVGAAAVLYKLKNRAEIEEEIVTEETEAAA